MIIIPEIQKVFIRVPRTGSGSLKSAILNKYPKAIELYHHMESRGIPLFYNSWQVVGVVRHPVARLWSLYNFCKTVKGGHPLWGEQMRASVADREFWDWLLHNDVPFCQPSIGDLFIPKYGVIQVLAENRKTMKSYFGTDNTKIFAFEKLGECAAYLGVDLGDRMNMTEEVPTNPPPIPDHLMQEVAIWGLDRADDFMMWMNA